MKAKMYSEKAHSDLFHHIIDGFETTFEGIQKAHETQVISDQELTEFLKKNSTRLIERIREFKIMNGLISIFFAGMFCLMQVGGEDLEMRRSSVRARTSRTTTRTRSRKD